MLGLFHTIHQDHWIIYWFYYKAVRIFSNGRVLTIAHTTSFMVLMYHSISGTRSLSPIVLPIIQVGSIWFLMFSKCLSLSMWHILKPLPWYAFIFVWVMSQLSSFFHLYHSGSTNMYCTRCCHHEWYFIYVHDINGQGDGIGQFVAWGDFHSLGCLPCCLPFDRSQICLYIFCEQNVCLGY